MPSCPPVTALARLLANDLSEPDRTLVEDHVEDCSACQDGLNQLVQTAPGPAPTQLLSALSIGNDAYATTKADEFIEVLKRNLLSDGSGGRAPEVGEPDWRPKVAGYQVLEELGRGASGVVFRARHLELDRLVALKMIFTGPRMSAEVRQRLRIEAQAIARLRHPGIVQVYDVDESADCPYLALELVEGENLARWKGDGPRPAALAVRLVATMAEAVAYAHGQGVIHRDLKPANVLIGMRPDGASCSLTEDAHPIELTDYELKITDFGLARVLPGPGSAEARLTQSGMILGTPAYLAPEQAQGKTKEIGPATDIYSLGAILYELLTGRPPFVGDTAMEVLLRGAHEDPVPPTRLVPQLSRELDTICLKCLEKDPLKRYASASELAADLGRFSKDEPILARPVGRLERAVRSIRRRPATTALITGNLLLAIMVAWGGYSLNRAKVSSPDKERRPAAGPRNQPASDEASANLGQNEFRFGDDLAAERKRTADRARSEWEVVERQARFTQRLAAIRISRATVLAIGTGRGDAAAEARFRRARADRHYEQAFDEAGLTKLTDNPRDAAAQIAAAAGRDAILAGLDDWAACAVDEKHRNVLLTIARLADQDAWRSRARDPATWYDRAALADLERTAQVADQPISLLIVLGNRLQASGLDAIPFFNRVVTAHPSEFWANFAMGNLLNQARPFDAANWYRKALAIRPRSSAVFNNLGIGACQSGRFHEAVTYFQKAVEFDHYHADAYNNLGLAHKALGNWREATARFLESLELNSESPAALYNLAEIESRSGRLTDAVDHYRHAIQVDPSFASAHYMLGVARLASTELEQSVEEQRRATRVDPGNKRMYDVLAGYAYNDARERYSRAFAFDPRWSPGHFELPMTAAKNSLNEAADCYRQAIRLDPGFARAHGALGQALLAQGELSEALAATRRGLDLLPEGEGVRENLTSQLRRCARLLVLAERLPEIRKGIDKPAAMGERLELADLCTLKRHYVSAARYYGEIVGTAPRSAANLLSHDRRIAASAAVLAGCGHGEESAALSEAERSRWLEQARAWLRAELVDHSRTFDGGSSPDRSAVFRALAELQIDPAVVWLRNHDTATGLSPTDRHNFGTLWDALARLFKRLLDARVQGKIDPPPSRSHNHQPGGSLVPILPRAIFASFESTVPSPFKSAHTSYV